MKHQFSIDPALCSESIKKLEKQIEELNYEIGDIYRRAIVGDGLPAAQIIVEHMGAKPEELKMLSKVFDRLAVLIAKQQDKLKKKNALEFIDKKENWIYDQIGVPARDLDSFLSSLEVE